MPQKLDMICVNFTNVQGDRVVYMLDTPNTVRLCAFPNCKMDTPSYRIKALTEVNNGRHVVNVDYDGICLYCADALIDRWGHGKKFRGEIQHKTVLDFAPASDGTLNHHDVGKQVRDALKELGK